MKYSYIYPLILCLAVGVLFSSCNKEEEDEKKYMTGSITYDFPQYCLIGATIETYCTGIKEPSDVEYYWISPDLLGSGDTLRSQSATFTIPNKKGEYKVTAYAVKDGYYASTRAATVKALDPDVENGSVSGLKVSEHVFVDARDGMEYYYEKIGSLEWMTENLAYNPGGDKKSCVAYYNQDLLRVIFGYLYSWNDATGGVAGSGLGQGPQGVCPEGWSIPTEEDWEDLAKTISGGAEYDFYDNWEGLAPYLTVEAQFNETKMWPYCPNFDKKNTVGWNALPCGNSTDYYTRYRHLLEYGMWWSASEKNGKGSYRYIYYYSPDVSYHSVNKEDFGASVRCVRLAK